MSEVVPHSRPTLGEDEEAAVTEAVRSGHPAGGRQVRALEEEVSSYFEHPDSVAVGSGSQALLVALRSLDLGVGKRVAIPAFTCAAVLHAVEWAGAEPVLLDLAEGELAPAPSCLEHVEGQIDAAIVVHPWGYPLDIATWIDSIPIVIEDCAQGIGAKWSGQAVGRGGVIATISFYATKMLCAGEGGILSSENEEVNERARDLRDYDGKSEWAPRFNFKMSDLQAALARVQWSRLSEFIEKRCQIARFYDQEVPSTGLTPVASQPEAEITYYRYLCWSPGDISPLLDYCEEKGVHCRRPVPVPLDLLKNRPRLPNTSRAWEQLISLPIYPTLTDEEQNRVLTVLGEARKEGLIS